MRCADLVPIFNLVANLASTSECHSIYSILKLRCHTVATLTTSLRSDISEAELAYPFQAPSTRMRFAGGCSGKAATNQDPLRSRSRLLKF